MIEFYKWCWGHSDGWIIAPFLLLHGLALVGCIYLVSYYNLWEIPAAIVGFVIYKWCRAIYKAYKEDTNG